MTPEQATVKAKEIALRRRAEMAMNAQEFLSAAQAEMADRAKTYDQPEGERSMARTVAAFGAITGHQLAEAEGWLFMQILKDVRQWQGPGYHHDSAVDGVAYAALKAEALAAGDGR